MRHYTLIATTVLCATGAAACHHGGRASDPDNVAYRPDTTMTSSASSSASATPSYGASSATSQDTSSSAMSSTSGNAMSRGTSGRAGVQRERSEIFRAIHTLDRARYALEHASHEYGGHRTSALRAVDGALAELHAAAAQEARPQTARIERVEAKELHQAVIDLEHARRDMETAKHNFGGRKTETLHAVDTALSELRVAAENEK